MIKEDYCSFEVAKLLKEKGFNEPCLYYYFSNGKTGKIKGLKERNCPSVNTFSMPTHQMAMKWLREEHELLISIDASPIYGKVKDEKGRSTCGLIYWHYMASGEWINYRHDATKKAFIVSSKSYEEAVEAAIKYTLENLI